MLYVCLNVSFFVFQIGGMSGAEAPSPDAVVQAEEAKARANEFFKTEKYPLVRILFLMVVMSMRQKKPMNSSRVRNIRWSECTWL